MCVLVEKTWFIGTKHTAFMCLHQNTASIVNKRHYKKYKNRCVFNIYIILLRPVFNQTYEQDKIDQKILMSSLSWIGPIPTINK